MTEPIPLVVTRWKCPHCHRSRASKRRTTEHIGRCWHNPATRSCKTCVHFSPGSDSPDHGMYDPPEKEYTRSPTSISR